MKMRNSLKRRTINWNRSNSKKSSIFVILRGGASVGAISGKELQNGEEIRKLLTFLVSSDEE